MAFFQIIIHFSIGFIASFLGSIPPGSISAGVIKLSFAGRVVEVVWFIIGATIAELVYSFIAIHFSGYLLSIPKLEFYIQLASIPIFTGLGIFYFLSKPKKKIPENSELVIDNNANTFFQGILLGFLNPLQVPFWLAYGAYMLSVGWIKEDFLLLNIFVLGVISGSSILLFLVAKFSFYYSSKFTVNDRIISLITGTILIGLALIQLIKILL